MNSTLVRDWMNDLFKGAYSKSLDADASSPPGDPMSALPSNGAALVYGNNDPHDGHYSSAADPSCDVPTGLSNATMDKDAAVSPQRPTCSQTPFDLLNITHM